VPHLPEGVLDRARALVAQGSRRVLGVAGAPGAGKSTVAELLGAALGEACVVVPMDGFHLAQERLDALGRADRKGAPDTFDAAGFVALLRRIREQGPGDAVVYAPRFHREIEEPVAGAIAVAPDVPLVVVEGNYLLVADGEWAGVRPLLDECWYVQPDDEARRARLIARHEAFGKPPALARQFALVSDERNAEVVAASRARADLVLQLG
jgi:pantothenate kinase